MTVVGLESKGVLNMNEQSHVGGLLYTDYVAWRRRDNGRA
jgi:hypothetical protein